MRRAAVVGFDVVKWKMRWRFQAGSDVVLMRFVCDGGRDGGRAEQGTAMIAAGMEGVEWWWRCVLYVGGTECRKECSRRASPRRSHAHFEANPFVRLASPCPGLEADCCTSLTLVLCYSTPRPDSFLPSAPRPIALPCPCRPRSTFLSTMWIPRGRCQSNFRSEPLLHLLSPLHMLPPRHILAHA